jgi:poly-gamma-glutamate synthesis protein (capsule biosynthesis protein)
LIKHDVRRIAPEKSAAMSALLEGHDVVLTNLETGIDAGRGAPTRRGRFFHATSPEVLDCLEEWHFNLLALSNNHSWDFGPEGILAAIDGVEARGFVHAGTGADLTTASAPAVRVTPKGRVALVSMASGSGNGADAAATNGRPGINEVQLDPQTGEIDAAHARRVFTAVRAAASAADIVIVYQHDHYWEKDFRVTPEWKKRFARACIDAGATVFVSHGAPLLQGIELYRGRLIFYDLGSIVFHTVTPLEYYPPEVWETMIAEAEFAAGRLVSLRLRPVALNERGEGEPTAPRFFQTRGLPTLATGAQGHAILDRMQRLSAGYGTRILIQNGTAMVDLDPRSRTSRSGEVRE